MLLNTLFRQARASLRLVRFNQLRTPRLQPVFLKPQAFSHSFFLTRTLAYDRRQPSPPSPTLYVGNLPYSTQKEELQIMFEPHGEIRDIRVSVVDGRPRGFAHIEFSSIEQAEAAVNAHEQSPLYIQDRHLVLDFAPGERVPKFPPSNGLWIGNFFGTVAELKELFKDFEAHTSGFRMTSQPSTGQPTGNAFVNFDTVENASAALKALKDREIEPGKRIRVDFSRGTDSIRDSSSGRRRGEQPWLQRGRRS